MKKGQMIVVEMSEEKKLRKQGMNPGELAKTSGRRLSV
jgi:hypothetical protein